MDLNTAVVTACVNQISELYSEVDYLDSSRQVVPEVVGRPNTVPVTGDSFCQCGPQEEPSLGALLQGLQPTNDCLCGEEDEGECG